MFTSHVGLTDLAHAWPEHTHLLAPSCLHPDGHAGTKPRYSLATTSLKNARAMQTSAQSRVPDIAGSHASGSPPVLAVQV